MQNACGTIDYNDDKWNVISNIINTIRQKVKTLNVEEIDTPILENTDLLLKKYGDEAESKLIYNLKDGTSLRYDLTVPLVRYFCNNGLESMRRFQVGKVFRKDNSEVEKGRFREFYQADLDIVGNYEHLASEIEIFWLINSVLEELGIEKYTIKYNYRNNLYDMCKKIGVTNDKYIKSICTSIDKLDKFIWEQVAKELLQVRKLSQQQVDKLKELIESNYLSESLVETDKKLNQYAKNLTRDSSLARGLDYYTGIIYEVIINDSKTVIAGGRYDKMIYKSLKNGKKYIPAIGVSFGVSRLFFFSKKKEFKMKKVFIISNDFDMKMKLLDFFRNYNYLVNYDNLNRKVIKQITEAVKSDYNYIALYGEDGDKIKIKELFNNNPDNLYDFEDLGKITH